MTSKAALAIALFVSAGLAGCDSAYTVQSRDTLTTQAVSEKRDPATAETTTGQPMPPAQAGQPKLTPGDKIRIVVYGEDKLSGDYDIDHSGMITVPLIGAIKTDGLSKDELEKLLARKLREGQILRRPVVTVNIAAFRPFYVLGEVEKPGGYSYHNGLNAMSAVALAGGYTYRASKSRVLVQRSGEKGFKEYPLSPDIPIYPGDLISVPERYF